MKSPLVLLTVPLLAAGCRTTPDYHRPLLPGAPALLELGPDEALPSVAHEWQRRDELLPALERSIAWTRREHARRFFPIAGITHERALRSLERFRDLLEGSAGPVAFEHAVAREFTVYKSAGWDGRGGGVLFTGYCTPILHGSTQPTERFRHPLYALPDDLEKGPDGEILGWRTRFGLLEYPSRSAIEAGGLLRDRGLELVWLEDPLDAYVAHVNGSAFVELEDGQLLRFGYAGKNGLPYTSLGRELIAEGEVAEEAMSLAAIRAWARTAPPDRVEELLHRNRSYVFFQPIDGNPHGSLDVEVTAGRSLATDKTLFPRGALVFVDAKLAAEGPSQPFRQFLFDQDTGGAIRTAGHADIYFGIGPEAEVAAGRTRAEGQLYYLFAKE